MSMASTSDVAPHVPRYHPTSWQAAADHAGGRGADLKARDSVLRKITPQHRAGAIVGLQREGLAVAGITKP